MTYWYTVNFALGCVFTVLVGFFVLFRQESRRITRYTWFLLSLSTGLWHAGRFLMAVAPSELSAERSIYVIYFGAIFIPPFFLHFILSLLNEEKKRRTVLILSYFIAFCVLALLISGQLTRGVQVFPSTSFYEIPRPLYLLFTGVFAVLPTYAIYRLVGAYFKSDQAVRKNQFPSCSASLVAADPR